MVKILTERGFVSAFSRQVVYEWEDDFASVLNAPLEQLDNYQKHPIARLMRKVFRSRPIRWVPGQDVRLFLAMNIDLLRLTCWYLPNTIPILLDVTLEEIDELHSLTKQLPVYYVTSVVLRDRILERYPDSRVKYLPQSVASEERLWGGDERPHYKNKDIDMIQFGRRNPVLHQYACHYSETHPNVSYCYRDDDPSHGCVRYENGKAESIGVIRTRADFLAHLSRSRISLCSTPLMDETRDFGAGIDFLTARWFESAACRCHILGRWSESAQPEVEKTGLCSIAHNIDSYEAFEKAVDEALQTQPDEQLYRQFLVANTAAARAVCVLADLRKANALSS